MRRAGWEFSGSGGAKEYPWGMGSCMNWHGMGDGEGRWWHKERRIGDCRGEEKCGGQCIYCCCSTGRSAVDPFPFESPWSTISALSIATTLPWDNNINKYMRVNIRKLYQAGTPLFSLWSIAETLHRSPIGPPAFPFASFHPE